jgi:aminoglycoside phosphotransferase (APT) family kinase protein
MVLCDGRSGVRILERCPAIWASTYPSEVVTCQVDGWSSELKLYCKYMAGLHYESFGHRGGVAYEVEVYRDVLDGAGMPVPRFYGAYFDPETGDQWLVLEFLDRAVRVTKGPQPKSVVKAASWLGRFHAANETRISTPRLNFLNVYDAAYYLGWSQRTLRFATELRSAFPWLETLCGRFAECAEILLSCRPTIIHGEFYPHNILLNSGQIYPIDWESAAVGAGEIDLVTLTEAWLPNHLRQCEAAYQKARWGRAAPAGFERTLAAARLYMCFRWMGDQPEWTLGAGNGEYFDRMRASGEELGLI